jgi:hypothetical protein
MTAAESMSRIGNRTDVRRILDEKYEGGGGCFGDYFGNPGFDGRFKMDVGEINCEAWNGLNYLLLW